MNRIYSNPHVGIIGAGIAGLYAARQLERAGANVTVFEADSRVGGRIYTRRSSAGAAEFGAMRIHPSHKLVFNLIRDLGISVRRFVNTNPAAYYLIGNRRFQVGKVAGECEIFSELEPDPRRAIQDTLSGLSSHMNDKDLADIERGVLPAHLENLDSTSLWDLTPSGLSPDAKAFGMMAKSLIQYAGISGLEAAILARFAGGDVMYEITDGMDTLTTAVATKLKRAVLLNHKVRSVRAIDGGVVTVSLSPAGVRFDVFDAVLCTVPAPAVSRIAFAPDLPFMQKMAFNQVHYVSAAKSLVTVTERIWELSDGIYGGISVTDGIAQNVVYPSDNRAGNLPFFVRNAEDIAESDPTSSADLPGGLLDPARSASRSILCGLYAREGAARRFMSLTTAEKDEEVVHVLEALHPGIRSRILDVEHYCWDLHSNTGGGAFAHYYPGERGRLQSHMGTAWPSDHARVWFAGEHLSAFHGWIEGALRSVENVLDNFNALAVAPASEPLATV